MSKSQLSQNEDIMALIGQNMHREDFRKYLGLCVQKWERLKVELEIIDAIMSSICKQWGISRQELIDGKEYIKPRSLMYYIIKREVSLSYQEIGELFGRPKSYVHKAVDGMAFFVEQNGNKNKGLIRDKGLIRAFHNVRVDLYGKNTKKIFGD